MGKQLIIDLAHEFAEEADAANDLWTWLPSYKTAQRYHGDYAAEHRPSTADVMREAAECLARIAHPDSPPTLEEVRRVNECPCGEDHYP